MEKPHPRPLSKWRGEKENKTLYLLLFKVPLQLERDLGRGFTAFNYSIATNTHPPGLLLQLWHPQQGWFQKGSVPVCFRHRACGG